MDRPVRRCSFCGRPQGEVRLVGGPADVYICQLCVAQCSEILAQAASPPDRPAAPEARGGSGPLIRTEISSSAKAIHPETAGR